MIVKIINKMLFGAVVIMATSGVSNSSQPDPLLQGDAIQRSRSTVNIAHFTESEKERPFLKSNNAPVTPAMDNIVKIIVPTLSWLIPKQDGKYDNALVIDISYPTLKASLIKLLCEHPEQIQNNELLQKILTISEKIEKIFKDNAPQGFENAGVIDITEELLDELYDMFIGDNGLAYFTAGTLEADKNEFKTLFTFMVKNHTGFQRIMSLIMMQAKMDFQKLEIMLADNGGSKLILGESDLFRGSNRHNTVLISKSDRAIYPLDEEFAQAVCHELTHYYHYLIFSYSINYLLSSKESIKNIINSMMAHKKLAFVYEYFPELKDIDVKIEELAASIREPEDLLKEDFCVLKINQLITQNNNAGLGGLMDNIEDVSQLNIMNPTEFKKQIAEIMYLSSYLCYPHGNVWTNSEEVLTIKGVLNFMTTNGSVVIVDRQYENAFAEIYGKRGPRTCHAQTSDDVIVNRQSQDGLLAAAKEYFCKYPSSQINEISDSDKTARFLSELSVKLERHYVENQEKYTYFCRDLTNTTNTDVDFSETLANAENDSDCLSRIATLTKYIDLSMIDFAGKTSFSLRGASSSFHQVCAQGINVILSKLVYNGKFPNLEKLDFSNLSNFNDECATVLCDTIKSNKLPKLTELNLAGTGLLTDKGAEEVLWTILGLPDVDIECFTKVDCLTANITKNTNMKLKLLLNKGLSLQLRKLIISNLEGNSEIILKDIKIDKDKGEIKDQILSVNRRLLQLVKSIDFSGVTLTQRDVELISLKLADEQIKGLTAEQMLTIKDTREAKKQARAQAGE